MRPTPGTRLGPYAILVLGLLVAATGTSHAAGADSTGADSTLAPESPPAKRARLSAPT